MPLPIRIKLPDSLLGEYGEYKRITEDYDRTTTGNVSYQNPDTLVTTDTTGSTYDGQGEEGLALLLFNEAPSSLKTYIFSDDIYEQTKDAIEQSMTPVVPSSGTATDIVVTIPSDYDEFKLDIPATITGANININVNGAGLLPLYSDYALTENTTELEAGIYTIFNRTTAFLKASSDAGYISWNQQYTGANEIIKDPKVKDVIVKVAESVYNQSYSTIVDGYVIPSLTDATWDEELKLLTELPNGTKDTILEKLIGHTVTLDGSETYTTFASGQGLNNDLALMRLPSYLDANNYYNDNTIASGFMIGNDGVGDYDARSSTGSLTGRGFTINGTDNLFIAIPESALDTVDATGFVKYIKQNPIKFKLLLASPVALNDTILKMNNPDDYKVYNGFKSKEDLFATTMNMNGETFPSGQSTINTNELISHVGSGVLHYWKGDSLEVDGVYLTNSDGFRGDTEFKTGYRILGSAPGDEAFAQHTNRDGVAEILTANMSAGGGYSLQLSDTGMGVIKAIGIQANTKIIVDGVTLYDKNSSLGFGVAQLNIPYYESFELYTVSSPIYSFNKII